MLDEFITTYRDAIIERARQKLTARPWPSASVQELENGVPLFLTQLSQALRTESTGTPHSPRDIGSTATRHGRELLALGFTVSQVVHDYGDICQAITEIAIEQNAPITTDEFKTLNHCLDTATAEAVTEHARITAEGRATEESKRSGHVAHETRDLLNTAILAYEALKRGTVAINGSTGAVLGRSLMNLRDLVDTTLSEIRIAANQQRRERLSVTPFLTDIANAGRLHAEALGLQFAVEPGGPTWAVTADPQLLASAVTNLLNNAFKYTAPGGRVVLRATTNDDAHLLIDIEDECGGIPESEGDPFQSFGKRRGRDRTGLGRGLSIARKAVRAHGGDIHIRNLPGAILVTVAATKATTFEAILFQASISHQLDRPAPQVHSIGVSGQIRTLALFAGGPELPVECRERDCCADRLLPGHGRRELNRVVVEQRDGPGEGLRA